MRIYIYIYVSYGSRADYSPGSSGSRVADWLLINWLRRAASSFPSPLARSRAARISESDSSSVDAEIDTP